MKVYIPIMKHVSFGMYDDGYDYDEILGVCKTIDKAKEVCFSYEFDADEYASVSRITEDPVDEIKPFVRRVTIYFGDESAGYIHNFEIKEEDVIE